MVDNVGQCALQAGCIKVMSILSRSAAASMHSDDATWFPSQDRSVTSMQLTFRTMLCYGVIPKAQGFFTPLLVLPTQSTNV